MTESQNKDNNSLDNKPKNIDLSAVNKEELFKKVIEKNDKVAWRALEGEVIIITPHDSTQHYINEVGAMIWEFADGNRTVGDIIKLMKTEYREDIEDKNVSEKEIEDDTIEFILDLSSKEKEIVYLK